MRKILHRSAALLFMAGIFVFNASKVAASTVEDVIRANADWIADINAGNHVDGLNTFADDVALIGPDGPIMMGIETVRPAMEPVTSKKGFHIEFTLTEASITSDGTTGFVVGETRIGSPGPDGEMRATAQRLLTVWRKDAAEKWRCWLNVMIPPRSAS